MIVVKKKKAIYVTNLISNQETLNTKKVG